MAMMNSSNVSSDKPVLRNHVFRPAVHRMPNVSREYDTAGWIFNTETTTVPNLAFLPILGIILLVACCLMKVYSWCRESDRMKARGDVEFGDESDVNYGIISAGDKDFCHVDIRSDGASLYDTVNSFRLLGNGFTTQLSGTHPCHDTVTSYKSLLMQRADGSQYDSVKSYKAFLQKVTQDKDLAVEVKLLENYPIRSKSAEHCVVLEEESSERSEDMATKMLGTIPLNKHLHQPNLCLQYDKKKGRYRRASGDPPVTMRKRAASNPTSRRAAVPVSSLPSICYPLSSDSEDDDQQSFRMDRKKLWAERKKTPDSVSGPKILKDPNSAATLKTLVPDKNGGPNVHKRRRHFSADSARRPKKAANTLNKGSGEFVNNDKNIDLKNTSQTKANSRSRKKNKRPVHSGLDESSSENPPSSHSSCNSDVQSDVMTSDSDEDTKQNTLLSNASDDQTMENDVFFSVDSGAELASSTELLDSSPNRSLSETRKLIARAKEEFFLKPEHNRLSVPPTAQATVTTSSSASLDNQNSSVNQDLGLSDQAPVPRRDDHSTLQEGQARTECQQADVSSVTTSDTVIPSQREETTGNPDNNSPSGSSPRIVQRFHVTFVNPDLSSLNSD